MIVRYKEFRGAFKSWDKLYSEASEFGTRIGKDRLISFSQAVHGNAVVTVWYWGDAELNPIS
ncbi:hypothetical protein ACFL5P_03640 [candidate division KSB1 bacterium]